MTSSSVEDTVDLSQVDASPPAPSQGENTVSPNTSPPRLSSTLLSETSGAISFVDTSPGSPASSPSYQSASPLLFPLPASLAGKSGTPLAELVADIGSTSIVTPDTATVEMVVAGEWPDGSLSLNLFLNVLLYYARPSVDGSFVDTSSGSAAWEFKKVLDQRYGVNVQIRSPYTVTGFINQHGQKRYRVG